MAKVLSVTQLNHYIKGIFEDEILLHNIEVSGEISEFNISNNNTYIVLKENDYVLPCIKFGAYEQIPVGTKVIIKGAVSFYEKGAKVSLNIKTISICGEGESYIKFLKLKQKLQSEGLFDKAKPMPHFIKRIAFISSAGGAVVHDFLSVNKKRHNIETVIFDTRVQGEKADIDILNAFNLALSYKLPFDCIVLARGGGANADLETFNSEILARAVANCDIPVISAIGHEVDYTLCDFCACIRAGTPSIAAEIISSVNDTVINIFLSLSARISENAVAIYENKQGKFFSLQRSVQKSAELKLAVCENSLQNFVKRLSRAVININETSANKVINKAAKLNSYIENIYSKKENRYLRTDAVLERLSPLKILSKGYARILKGENTVFSINEVNINDSITVILKDGKISADIKQIGELNK